MRSSLVVVLHVTGKHWGVWYACGVRWGINDEDLQFLNTCLKARLSGVISMAF